MEHITLFVLSLMRFKGVGEQSVLKFIEQSQDKSELILEFSGLMRTNLFAIKKNVDDESLNAYSWKKAINLSEKIIEDAKSKNICIINYLEETYPKRMRSLKKFPILLYAKGNVELLNYSKSIAIIGTREPSVFGEMMGKKISSLISNKNFSIVSGLAKGCDTIAHKAALENSGKTVAILAHGLDIPVYPKENRELAKQIIKSGGLLLSTYSLGTKLRPQYLAARDEWQSGLSDGIIVIETGIKGGTNITVNYAINQKRPVGVIDHSQFKNGELNNLKQAQGNLKYISEKKAFPLYELESIDNFIKILERKNILNNKDINVREKQENLTQIDIFDQ